MAASPHDLKVVGSNPALATFLRDKPFDQQHNGLFPRDAKSYVIKLAAQTSDSEDSAICTAIYLSQALQKFKRFHHNVDDFGPITTAKLMASLPSLR